MNLNAILCVIFAAAASTAVARAETTPVEKVQEVGQDAVKNTKKAYRGASDKVCEMVNGKMKCLPKKVKHKAQNAADEVKDQADDVKKKVN